MHIFAEYQITITLLARYFAGCYCRQKEKSSIPIYTNGIAVANNFSYMNTHVLRIANIL